MSRAGQKGSKIDPVPNVKKTSNMGEEDDFSASWITDLTDEDFARAIMSSENVVVEFWQELCAPCAIMKPIYENASEPYNGTVKFARAKVNSAQAVLSLFRVFNVPTFLFFHDGKVVDTLIGIVSGETLENSLKKISTL